MLTLEDHDLGSAPEAQEQEKSMVIDTSWHDIDLHHLPRPFPGPQPQCLFPRSPNKDVKMLESPHTL